MLLGTEALFPNLAGRTVAEVRRIMAEPLGVDPTTQAFVNRQPVSDDYRLQASDVLEFVRPV